MTNQTKTNNLNHLIDSTFNKVDRLFVLSFENKEDRWFLKKYYTPKVETKDFNMLVDGNIFFFWFADKKQRRSIQKKLWALVKIMITQLVIYWTMNTFQNIAN